MRSLPLFVVSHIALLMIVVSTGLILNGRVTRYTAEYAGLIAILSTSFGVYSFVINLLYQRNRHVYFLVNRLFLALSRTHTYWKPSFDFTLAADALSDRSTALPKAISAIESGNLGALKHSESTATMARLVIDDHFCLVLRFDGNHLSVTLDRKQLVPSHLYDSFCRKLARIGELVQSAIGPVSDSCFAITISFGDGVSNPYYGFFVNRVPSELLSHFAVGFRLSRESQCRIEAGKDYVNIDGKSLLDVFAGVAQVVSLRAVPDGVA